MHHQVRDDASRELPGALAVAAGDWQVCSSGCEDRLWVHIHSALGRGGCG